MSPRTPRNPYDASFYLDQSGGSRQAAKELLPIVLAMLGPKSILDVGCGLGTWLAEARDSGVFDVVGVDGSYVNSQMLQIPSEQFVRHDLTIPLMLNRRFDLVISLEVGEHLPDSAAETFVESLVRHAPVVMFSAAIPAQGGIRHINEQWPGYWIAHFRKHGYIAVDCLRDRIWENSKVTVCYRQNVFLYVEGRFLRSHLILKSQSERSKQLPTALVHPDLFREVLSRPLSTRQILKEMPGALRETLSARVRRLLGKTY